MFEPSAKARQPRRPSHSSTTGRAARAADESPEPFDAALRRAFEGLFSSEASPPRLREAMEVALLAGGGRARPRLCLAVAEATGAENLDLATTYAIALELAHAASLVHDDLPAFDDAAQRRGRPTVHVLYGVPTAVLVGDGLLVASFDVLARTAAVAPDRVARALSILARALGAERGLVAGQAWESELTVDLDQYHQAKTGGLFEAAACLGALSSGVEGEPFRAFGTRIGHAYQTADDLLDATGTQSEAGKPVGVDERHGRPNAARTFGLARARANLSRMVAEAIAAIPPAADRAPLVRWVDALAGKMRSPASL